mmetsp:Transcript_15701/g.22023  ORF Transcript_15701/g.22023 Transcript_15701/m.22023 type:complete len:104 (+) Transcript_15701:886-1197(+)
MWSLFIIYEQALKKRIYEHREEIQQKDGMIESYKLKSLDLQCTRGITFILQFTLQSLSKRGFSRARGSIDIYYLWPIYYLAVTVAVVEKLRLRLHSRTTIPGG